MLNFFDTILCILKFIEEFGYPMCLDQYIVKIQMISLEHV